MRPLLTKPLLCINRKGINIMAEVFDNDLHDYLTRLDDDETDGERRI